jgi:polysaccharide export outer membrane protein
MHAFSRYLKTAAACVLATLSLAGCGTSPPSVERRDVTVEPARGAAPAWRRAGLLGPGDQVDIFVWGYPDYTRRATVGFNGSLPYPVVGELAVAGKTLEQVNEQVRLALSDFIKEPVVKVTVATSRPQRIQVLGEVAKPGAYSLPAPDTSLIEALALAGGPTLDARLGNLLVVRDLGKQVEIHTIDYRRITREGDVSGNLRLQDGDIVFMPVAVIADITREASRISQLLGTLLLFQNTTLLWEPFTNALRNRDAAAAASSSNPIVINVTP